MVSIVELIMLSRQQLLLHNFQNTRVTWLSVASLSYESVISYMAYKISQFLMEIVTCHI